MSRSLEQKRATIYQKESLIALLQWSLLQKVRIVVVVVEVLVVVTVAPTTTTVIIIHMVYYYTCYV